MSLAEMKSALRRRIILDALADDPNYSISYAVLRDLLAELNHATTDTNRDLVWLEENALITTKTLGEPPMPIATITPLGEDVARGRKSFTGVRRHRAGE